MTTFLSYSRFSRLSLRFPHHPLSSHSSIHFGPPFRLPPRSPSPSTPPPFYNPVFPFSPPPPVPSLQFTASPSNVFLACWGETQATLPIVSLHYVFCDALEGADGNQEGEGVPSQELMLRLCVSAAASSVQFSAFIFFLARLLRSGVHELRECIASGRNV